MRVLVRSEAQVAPWWNGGAEVITGDLREPETSKRAVEGVDAVVHIAAPNPPTSAARSARQAQPRGECVGWAGGTSIGGRDHYRLPLLQDRRG